MRHKSTAAPKRRLCSGRESELRHLDQPGAVLEPLLLEELEDADALEGLDRAALVARLGKLISDEQIDEIAAYYAVMEFVPAKQDFDAALAATGKAVHDDKCEKCHSDGGTNPDDEAGILGGQWMGYMKATFAEYRAGEREQPKSMEEVLNALSEDDAKALLHYYASLQ